MKTALITGAAQGLGLVTAGVLARAGFRLILVDVQEMRAAVEKLRREGAEVLESARGDVGSAAFVRQLGEHLECRYSAVDVLVNNAGISLIERAEDTTCEQWQRVMAVNLLAPFLLSKYLGAQMLKRKSGSIVNVASIAGLVGISHRSAYNASKHGLIGLTRTLAAEWGGRGVRVNAVCPGWIKTEMDAADQGSGAYSDRDILDRVPMERFARPEDVAQAIAFLADSEKSGFVNGATLNVDGGWTADGSWESLRVRARSSHAQD
jgi:NAD(P)-dependent dehydrogenase (short-subunit alcohol dehydrogenase family)